MKLHGGALIFVTRFTKDFKKVLAYNVHSNSLRFNSYERKNIADENIPIETGINAFKTKTYDKTASKRKNDLTLLLKPHLQ